MKKAKCQEVSLKSDENVLAKINNKLASWFLTFKPKLHITSTEFISISDYNIPPCGFGVSRIEPLSSPACCKGD